MQYQKVKSVAKRVLVKGPKLREKVLNTMSQISSIVGATLGPGGMPVLIERQEFNLPAMVTKDGVTVFRSLGFDDPTAHVILEAARDAAVRTASEAGDGTTTATVLSEAIARYTDLYCLNNKSVSPQRVVRQLMKVFDENINPLITSTTIIPKADDIDGRHALWNVARISANGDTALATAVMDCFNLVGDEGNVTLTEISGASGYEVEKIEGYPLTVGYEDSCAKFAPKFINDPALQRTVLENPLFVVFHGRITEIQSVVSLMEKIGAAWQNDNFRHNIVLVATGFSESVLAQLAVNFAEMTTINVFPLLAPLTPVPNGQLGILQDICAVTGSTLFDPLNKPLDAAELEELGDLAKTFEANRFRSVILADLDNDQVAINIEERVAELVSQRTQAASELDRSYFDERIGKLTGGIAKLRIIGASNGELRERRDRAEDAVCAVRGAIKSGYVPGGGWMLLKICDSLKKIYPEDPVINSILIPALETPVYKVLENSGLIHTEIEEIIGKLKASIRDNKFLVYDAYNHKYEHPYNSGILDSTPAVREAIRNSLSIASLLGTLGGTVVFARDSELERIEARETNSFLRNSDYPENPADERGM